MNVFLPKDGVQEEAMLIDFASCGVGFGASDVAMHLAHSVALSDLENGGEERLLDFYMQALKDANCDYPRDTFLRHYKLAVADYGRFVIARFWAAGKTTPEAFQAKATVKNRTLVNRNAEAALRFIKRIDECLHFIEEEVISLSKKK
jgi:hypothetical protein